MRPRRPVVLPAVVAPEPETPRRCAVSGCSGTVHTMGRTTIDVCETCWRRAPTPEQFIYWNTRDSAFRAACPADAMRAARARLVRAIQRG